MTEIDDNKATLKCDLKTTVCIDAAGSWSNIIHLLENRFLICLTDIFSLEIEKELNHHHYCPKCWSEQQLPI